MSTETFDGNDKFRVGGEKPEHTCNYQSQCAACVEDERLRTCGCGHISKDWVQAQIHRQTCSYMNTGPVSPEPSSPPAAEGMTASERLKAENAKLRQELDALKKIADKCGKENCMGQDVDGCRRWVTQERLDREREARTRAEDALREAQGVQEYLCGLVEASRDALAAFQKQAGWLPQQQAYSTKMTEAELQIAKAVQDLTAALAALNSPAADTKEGAHEKES